jgi:retinol dehydrogenase-14
MERLHSGPMAGRTVLVTGASGGIGRATALGLVRMGAHLAICGRDRESTEAAAGELHAGGGSQADVFVADLSSQVQVRRLAAEVLQRCSRIDVLVNNVGGYWDTRHVTADGLERTFALNHPAPFLLTNLLWERLAHSTPARVVTVSSNAHTQGRIQHLVHLRAGQEAAQLRHRQRAASRPDPHRPRAEDLAGVQRRLVPFLRPFMRTPAQGAATSIHLASAPELAHMTGRYFANRKPKGSSKASYDQAAAARLWQVSAHLVGLPTAD